jgi:predicted DNA-binding transcriptional regulator YafY
MSVCTMDELKRVEMNVRESIRTRRPLVFHYTKKDDYEDHERKVRFTNIYTKFGHTYACGYCYMRKVSRVRTIPH